MRAHKSCCITGVFRGYPPEYLVAAAQVPYLICRFGVVAGSIMGVAKIASAWAFGEHLRNSDFAVPSSIQGAEDLGLVAAGNRIAVKGLTHTEQTKQWQLFRDAIEPLLISNGKNLKN